MKWLIGSLAVMLTLGATDAQAQTFPADGAYVPFLCGLPAMISTDPRTDESIGAINLVGDANNYAFGWHVDAAGSFAYFRMRLEADPRFPAGDFRQFAWSFAIDTDGNTATVERRVVLDGVAEIIRIVNGAGVQVGANTYSPAMNARVTNAGTSIGGGTDVFLTFALPFNDLVAAGITGTIRVWAGSSTNSTGFTKDAACANNVTDTTVIVVPPTPTCGNTAMGAIDQGCTAARPVCDFGSGAPTCQVCEDNTVGGRDFSCPATAAGGACVTSSPWAPPFCAACTVNADCLVGTCNTATHMCVIMCMNDTVGGIDTGCSAMAPACEELGGGLGNCLACEDNTNMGNDNGCASGAPACSETGPAPVCAVCTDDGDGVVDHGCDTTNPACSPNGIAGPTCLECTADSDCSSGVCSGNVCVACADDSVAGMDSGCLAAAPFCDTSTAPVCVECLTNAHCPGGACDAGSCVPCLDTTTAGPDAGCGDVGDAGPVCSGSGSTATCVPCESAGNFGCGALTPVCDTSGVTPICVACVLDGDCTSGVCESNVCVGCRDNGLGVDDGCGGSLPVCDTTGAPTCTACADSGMGTDDGCSAATPNCDTTTTPVCVECLSSADCGAGICVGGMCTAVCTDTASGSGVDMGCTAGSPVCVSVNAASFCVPCDNQGDGVTDDGCSAATPACTMARSCVECTASADCSGGVCSASNTCVTCLDTTTGGTDAGCNVGAPVCNVSAGGRSCVPCEDTGSGTDFGCSMSAPTCMGTGAARVCVECVTDSECPGTFVCDQTSFTCGPECQSDADCTMEVCDMGTCVGCVDDLDCGPGNRCVASTCEPICTSDAQCSAPTPVCDVPNTTCVECVMTSDCASDQVCTASNTCVQGCVDNSQCSTPLPVCDTAAGNCTQCLVGGDCLSGVCTSSQVCVECEDDADCTGGDVCAPDNTCVGCVTDGDCGVGEVCGILLQTCMPGCVTDADCVDPRLPVCDGSGTCVECTTAADCSNGELCNNNVCEPPCTSDADCPAAHPVCSDAFLCVDCRTESDCDANEVCMAETCVPSCVTDADCTEPAAPVCNTTVGACVLCTATNATACATSSAGQLCVDLDTTPACGCSGDSDCPAGSSCGSNNRCMVNIAAPTGGISGGALCTAGAGSSSGLPAAMALLALVAVVTRRRRR